MNTKAKSILKSLLPVIGVVIVVVFLLIATGGRIFDPTNVSNLLNQGYTIMLLSLACSFIYAHGGFDLAVGSVFGLCMMASGMVVLSTGSLIIALPICIVISVLCYLAMATLNVKLLIPAFITSLCMKFLGRGLVSWLSSSNLVLPQEMSKYDNWTLKIIVLAVIIFVAFILMHHTAFGRRNMSIGESEIAARQSGINTGKVKMLAYIVAAIFVAFAAFFAMARLGTVTTTTGEGYEMDVIVAIVLGGMSIDGGMRSTILAPILGAVTVTLLENGLVIMGVSSNFIDGVIGVIFLIVILFTFKRTASKFLPRTK